MIDYLRHLVGVDYIGIGSDFGASKFVAPPPTKSFLYPPEMTYNQPNGLQYVSNFNRASQLPNLRTELRGRGYSSVDIAKICGGNWMRVFRHAWNDSVRGGVCSFVIQAFKRPTSGTGDIAGWFYGLGSIRRFSVISGGRGWLNRNSGRVRQRNDTVSWMPWRKIAPLASVMRDAMQTLASPTTRNTAAGWTSRGAAEPQQSDASSHRGPGPKGYQGSDDRIAGTPTSG